MIRALSAQEHEAVLKNNAAGRLARLKPNLKKG